MAINFLPTGSWRFIKPPQFIEESSFGVPPEAPTFSLLGNLTGISPNIGIQKEVIRNIGQRDPTTQTKLMEMFSGAFRYRPFDKSMMGYGINLANEASPAGTNAASVTVAWSLEINGTEKYFAFTGMKTNNISVEVSKDGGVTIGQDFRWKDSWMFKDDLTEAGINTPTWITSFPNTAPWTSLAGGVDPFTIEAVVWPTDRIKFDVNQNLDAISPNGSQSLEYLGATIRETSVDFDLWLKGSEMHDYLMSLQLIDASYTLFADPTTPVTISITDMGLDSQSMNFEGNANTFQRLGVAGTPNSITLT
ncbi:MAG: hypothetical protein L0H53_09610 [Candidatus Nitrosocosmicus sp.]|nr:hypothetical protein [Candidatus Nitrosocosmicus sp.]MDN5866863.1 hypothetical protein [Candidatus Nitrosocosmicus sp.]